MHYRDTWKQHLTEPKLKAYKSLIDEGRIVNHHVTYFRQTETTIVEYDADRMIHEEMKKRCLN